MPPPAGRDADRSGVMTKRVGLYLRVSTKNGQEEQVAGAPTRKAALCARHRHIDPQRQTLWRAEWIRTFSSALDRQQFVVSSEFGRSTVAHGHPSSCRPRRTDRVVGRCPERRHSPPGSDGVTPRSRCRRCERIAEPKVRIRSPPAVSQGRTRPRGLALLEATIVSERPMMGVFNNLVVFDQHVKQNSLNSIVPDLADEVGPTLLQRQRERSRPAGPCQRS